MIRNKMQNRFLKMTVIAAGVASLAGMTAYHPVETQSPVQMVADLSDKILYLYEGDSVTDMYDISDGKDPYPTPRGSFKVRKLTWNPRWIPPDSKWARKKTAKSPGDPENPMKVVKIFFKEPDFYIHGTGDLASLGSSESHGCLRMAPEDVMKVGKWVMEHGGQAQDENWFMRILHSRREEKVIYLSSPVPMLVRD